MISLLFLFVFIIFGKRVTPYFVATVQHLVGDYLVGGSIQAIWSLSVNWYGVGIEMTSLMNIIMEWTLFLISITIMLKAKDAWTLLRPRPSNLLLSIPASTVLIPELLSFPLSVPLALLIPHLTYLTIFAYSVLVDLEPSLRVEEKSLFE